jgi:L-lactate dehydrogenase (cytochrome)/(S)-mandelate dehydrogenase
MIASECINIDDLRATARRRVPRFVFDFVEGGAGDESGMRRNREALDRVRLAPRHLVDATRSDPGTELLGRRWSYPFGIAPIGLAGLARHGADTMLAQAAARADIPYVLSTAATTPIEAIARVAPRHLWFQLYVTRDRNITQDLMRRAREAGVEVLVVTVDSQVPGRRERNIRNGFTLPLRPSLGRLLDVASRPAWCLDMLRHGSPRLINLEQYARSGAGAQSLAQLMAAQIDPSLSWSDMEAIRAAWKGKMVIKGLMRVDDAIRAAEIGADGIVVSNHGGRQIDVTPAPIEVLPQIAAAVGARLAVLIDGGMHSGSDIAKALALGARFAFVGRAAVYGVAAGGRAGAEWSLRILAEQFDSTLAQLGCHAPAQLGEALWRA